MVIEPNLTDREGAFFTWGGGGGGSLEFFFRKKSWPSVEGLNVINGPKCNNILS